MMPCHHCSFGVRIQWQNWDEVLPVWVECGNCGARGPKAGSVWKAWQAWSEPGILKHAHAPADIAKKEGDAFYDQLVDIADSLSPELEESFLSLVEALRSRTTVAKLARALRSGGLSKLAEVIGWDDFAGDLADRSFTTLLSAAQQVIDHTAADLVAHTGIKLDEKAVAHRAAAYAERYAGEMATNLTQESHDAVASLVSDALAEGRPKDQLARSIREVIGLNTQQAASLDQFIVDIQDAVKPDGAVYSAAEIQRLIDREYNRMVTYRADVIARTELWESVNQAQLEGWKQAADDGAPIEGLDVLFVSRDGMAADAPPLHPMCLPGWQLVEVTSDIHAVTQRQYDGPLVTIETASGKKLTCTPNHPVLTLSGWQAAGVLKEGVDVICRFGGDPCGGLGHNDEHARPASIEEVARATREARKMAPREVEVTTEDFHGDGKHSKVAVVWTDSLLRPNTYPSLAKQGFKDNLGGGAVTLVGLNRFGNGGARSDRCLSSADSGVRSETSAFLDGVALIERAGRLSRAHSADSDTVLCEEAPHDLPTNAEAAGHGILGFPLQVALDCVVGIWKDEAFSGHVYNLQVESGWYLAGGIVTHNCYCSIRLRRQVADDMSVYYVREWIVAPKNPCDDCLAFDGVLAL